MYLDNKYTKWYNSIIFNAKNRKLFGYSENHHIIPRSLGGEDSESNIVKLTAREHYVCHLLLTKMTTGNNYYKMCYALNMISNIKQIGGGRYRPNSNLYEYSKKLYKESLDNFWSDEKRNEHAEKLRSIVKGRKHRLDSIEKMKNKKWTQKALDNRLKNCIKAAEARKGSKWNEDRYEMAFRQYIETNKDLFSQVFSLFDQGLNIRQISLNCKISWDRVKYMILNRSRINTIVESEK